MAATNQGKLQSIVQDYASGQPFFKEFQHFHLSVKQKLWSVDYFHNEITKLEPKILYQQRQTQGKTLVLDQYTDKEGFGLYANLILDGFLMTAMSVLDTIAHEIKILYKFHPVPQKIYIYTIKERLVQQHPHRALTKYLSDEVEKPWFGPFSTYRHCTTHESLVGSNIRYDETLITGEVTQASIILPDDPRSKPFTYERNRDLKSYCNGLRNRIIGLVKHSYYCIIQDIRAVNNVLPIT